MDEYVLYTSPTGTPPDKLRYTLLQLFIKYGKVAKLDFLFHKSGPLKGKPRGYAFVEYSNANVRPFLSF